MRNTSAARAPKSRYLVMPVAAFRSGEEFDSARLPVRVETRPWRTMAWAFFCIGGFFLVGIGLMSLESVLSSYDSGESWIRFTGFLWVLCFVLTVAGTLCWRRADIVEVSRDRVRVERRGLLGTDRRESPIRDYRGVRASERYVEDMEFTSGTWYWDVELVHADPALTVSLFARSRDVPGSGREDAPPADRADWDSHARTCAKQWSRDLDLPLLDA